MRAADGSAKPPSWCAKGIHGNKQSLSENLLCLLIQVSCPKDKVPLFETNMPCHSLSDRPGSRRAPHTRATRLGAHQTPTSMLRVSSFESSTAQSSTNDNHRTTSSAVPVWIVETRVIYYIASSGSRSAHGAGGRGVPERPCDLTSHSGPSGSLVAPPPPVRWLYLFIHPNRCVRRDCPIKQH